MVRYRTAYSASMAMLFLLLFCFASPATSRAITPISQGFATTDKLAQGSIVSLVNTSSDTVVASNSSNVDAIIGVVINGSDSLIDLNTGQSAQIQIATSGVVDVLVSNINGSISQGDQITASPIDGVGMKATENTRVVGIAQSDLTSAHGTSQTYTDKSGAKHSVLLGEVPVAVNVSYYYKQPQKTLIPQAVQNIADALAGKQVNPIPVLISMGIFIVTLIAVVSIIYSMIHSSIISVGRNPMSQSAIYRDLIQLSALVLGILAVSMVAIYLILARF